MLVRSMMIRRCSKVKYRVYTKYRSGHLNSGICCLFYTADLIEYHTPELISYRLSRMHTIQVPKIIQIQSIVPSVVQK